MFYDRENERLRVGAIIAAVLIIVSFVSSFKVIPTGYTGVRTTFGQIDPKPCNSGFNWKIPFVQSIEKVNNKQQELTIDSKIWSETSEQTIIFYQGVTVTYTINPEYSAWIFSNVSNYKKTLIGETTITSAVKAASVQFISIEATNRGLIEPAVQKSLQSALNSKYGGEVVIINNIAISDIDFEDSYNDAIAERQLAQIEYEKQQIELKLKEEAAATEARIKEANAEAEAKVKLTTAQAEADALLIKANAEAEANNKIGSSLNANLLKKLYYEAWDGKLPVYVSDGSLIITPD